MGIPPFIGFVHKRSFVLAITLVVLAVDHQPSSSKLVVECRQDYRYIANVSVILIFSATLGFRLTDGGL
jgi:amino acid permease